MGLGRDRLACLQGDAAPAPFFCGLAAGPGYLEQAPWPYCPAHVHEWDLRAQSRRMCNLRQAIAAI